MRAPSFGDSAGWPRSLATGEGTRSAPGSGPGPTSHRRAPRSLATGATPTNPLPSVLFDPGDSAGWPRSLATGEGTRAASGAGPAPTSHRRVAPVASHRGHPK